MDRIVYVLPIMSLILFSFVNVEAGRLPPPEKELPPEVELSAEYIGKAILVKWKLPTDETNNDIPYKWVLQRDYNSTGFTDIANGERDPNNKPLEEGREVNYYLDKVSERGVTFVYRMIFVSVDGRDTTESQATAKLEIKKDEPLIYSSIGNLLDTTRPLVPYTKPLIKAFNFEFIPPVYAPTFGLNPLVTSSLNPKDEPYLFSLSPIPNPNPGSECEQYLEILFKPSDNLGQSFEIYATILESQTIVRNQYLYENLPNSDKRIFNEWFIIPPEDQSIVNFEDLEVQLDIDSSTEIDPNNYRQLSIYEVNFYVPSENSSC